MSPSWASSVLYFGPDRVLLRSAGWKPASLHETPAKVALTATQRRSAGFQPASLHEAQPASPDWPGALAALQTLLAAHPIKGRVAVVLSSHFAPLWLLPGAPTRLNYEETRGWVEAQAAERFGDLAANWRLAFRPAPAGEPILASGIDAGHWAELLHTLTAAGLSAASVASWPALALARYGKSSTARLALAESGRLTLASLDGGKVVALDSVRGEPDALAGLLARAALVDGLGDAPLLMVGTGVPGDWAGAVLANSPEAAVLSWRAEPDFLQTRPRPPLAAWLLLAAGLGLAALSGQRYTALAEQLDAVPETSVAAKPRAARVVASPEAPARPWGDLLNRLESGRPQQIALLSLRGDALRGEARITAEARSEADMLAWLKTLRTDGFGDASLERHEVQVDAEQQPLRFEIRLGWGGR